MKRHQLEHVLRAASRIVEERDILVIGSQSILGSVSDERLPPEASASIEVDVTFFDDPDDAKSDAIDGAIVELSPFHETFGYYAQGVSASTALLPAGWQERVVELRTDGTQPGRGLCLERHDCVLAKLAAGRPKAYALQPCALLACSRPPGGRCRSTYPAPAGHPCTEEPAAPPKWPSACPPRPGNVPRHSPAPAASPSPNSHARP